MCNRCNLTPCLTRSLRHNANEHASLKSARKGVEDCRLHYLLFQHVSVIDELLGKLAAARHKPKKVHCRLMIRNNLKK